MKKQGRDAFQDSNTPYQHAAPKYIATIYAKTAALSLAGICPAFQCPDGLPALW